MVSKGAIIGGTIIVIIGIIIGLVASSLKKLSTEEAGLQYNTHTHKLKTRVYMAGLHLGPPGYEFIIFPRVYRTISFPRVQCLNKDGLTIYLNVQFQYLANTNENDLYKLIMRYKDHDSYLKVVKDAAESVIHDTCSEFDVTQFQTSRAQFQDRIRTSLQTRLMKELFTRVGDVQVSNIQRPSQYEQVVREKEAAKQNIIVAERERPRMITKADTDKKEAVTQAQITLNEAETQARILKTKARAEAEAILNAYQTEAQTYKAIMDNQKLSVKGLIAYLTTRAIQTASNPVYVNMDAPTKP